MNNLGNKIKDLREQKGVSQDKLAELMSVSRQTIYKWETTSVIPSLEKLKKLCFVLQSDLQTLLGDDYKNYTEAAVADDSDETQIKTKSKVPHIIGIAVLAIVFIISVFMAYVIGLVIFDPAPGDIVINTYNYTHVHFVTCLIISVLSLAAEILLIIFMIKRK